MLSELKMLMNDSDNLSAIGDRLTIPVEHIACITCPLDLRPVAPWRVEAPNSYGVLVRRKDDEDFWITATEGELVRAELPTPSLDTWAWIVGHMLRTAHRNERDYALAWGRYFDALAADGMLTVAQAYRLRQVVLTAKVRNVGDHPDKGRTIMQAVDMAGRDRGIADPVFRFDMQALATPRADENKVYLPLPPHCPAYGAIHYPMLMRAVGMPVLRVSRNHRPAAPIYGDASAVVAARGEEAAA